MLIPQSETKAVRGLSNFATDFRAADWMAPALDVFERFAEARCELDVSRKSPIKTLKSYGRPNRKKFPNER
jgi:hypothetical protein